MNPLNVKNNLGATVIIRERYVEDDKHVMGTVVGLSLWKNFSTGEMCGDRLIEFSDGLRLYYEPWMFDEVEA